VAPQSAHEFIENTYARTWAHYEGEGCRFQRLADWGTLNNLLATQRFEAPRFRVARQGKIVPVETYTEQIGTRANGFYRRIIPNRLLNELRDGATLTFDRVDHAHGPIRELAAVLESELRARVFINIFASWEPVPGFDVHWDDHDVLVIQLEGRKRWKIFEPTRQWPLYRDIVNNYKPEVPPVAELDMTAGDVLYLPHGWWHSVSALGEPSLHITIGIEPDNGIDFMMWLIDQVKSYELFRRRIPRLAHKCQQEEYLASVRECWNELMTQGNILDQFLTFADGTSRSRLLFHLPDILSTNLVLDRKSARIVLLASRATVTQADGGFVLTALGRRWSFPLVTKPLIDAVLSLDHVTVGEAIKSNAGVSEERSAQVIFKLLKAGVLALQ
jgi:hypothetical protein